MGKRRRWRASEEQERGARSAELASGSLLARRSPLHHKQGCCTAADAEDARRVADKLGIPFYALNLQAEFGADHRLLRRRVHGRPHAEPVRAVQQLDQVRQAVRLRRQRRRRVRRHGALRAARSSEPTAASRCSAASTRRRTSRTCCSGFGRELLPRMMLPVGGYEKPAIRRIAAELGPARRRQEGQPGNLLRHARAVRRIRAAAAHGRYGRRTGHDRRHGRRRTRGHRRLYRRAAQGARRRAGRAQVRRADRAGLAARGAWRSRRSWIAAS